MLFTEVCCISNILKNHAFWLTIRVWLEDNFTFLGPLSESFGLYARKEFFVCKNNFKFPLIILCLLIWQNYGINFFQNSLQLIQLNYNIHFFQKDFSFFKFPFIILAKVQYSYFSKSFQLFKINSSFLSICASSNKG